MTWLEAHEDMLQAREAWLEAHKAQQAQTGPEGGNRFLRGTYRWMDGLTMLDLRDLAGSLRGRAGSFRGLAKAFTDLG